LPVLLVGAFVIALILKAFVVQAFYIEYESMLPTLHTGDRVLVEKVSYRIGSPARGDIVVFEQNARVPPPEQSVWGGVRDSLRGLVGLPTSAGRDLVKRVVAVEGDEVEGRDGRLWVNGRAVDEPYVDGLPTYDFPATTVPKGAVFVMGDNRDNSEDSRSFGPVPVEDIIGKAIVRIWPLSRADAV
jgi:signal peptidase I